MIRPITITNFTQNTIQLKKTEKAMVSTNTITPQDNTATSYNIAFNGLFGPSKKKLEAERRRMEEEHQKAEAKKRAEEEAIREQHRLRTEADASAVRTQNLKNETKYLEELNKIQIEQIQPRLTDLIIRRNRGKLTEMPNCIMIACGTKQVNEDLIERTKEMAECRVVTIDETDGILASLEEAQKHFKEQNEWTLLHVKNFTNRINPKVAAFETIEAAKDWMSAAAKDYHTTILFSSENPDELDEIALEPHRTRKIKGNLISAREQNVQDAWNRVGTPEYIKTVPYDTQAYYIKERAENFPQNVVNDIIYIMENEGPNPVEKGKLKTSDDVLNYLFDNLLAPIYTYKPEKPEHEAYGANGFYNTFICNPFYQKDGLDILAYRAHLHTYEYLPLFAVSNPKYENPGTTEFGRLMRAASEVLRRGVENLDFDTEKILDLMIKHIKGPYFDFSWYTQCPGEIKNHIQDMYGCNAMSNAISSKHFELAKKQALYFFIEPLPDYKRTVKLIKALKVMY